LGISEKTNLKAEIGTIVHKVLEILAQQKKNIQDNKHFNDFQDKCLVNYIPVDDLYSQDNIEAIFNSVYDYYSSKSQNNFTPKEEKICRKYVQKALTFKDGIFDPRKQNIISPETFFDLPIEKDWAKLPNGEYLRIRGTIDLTVEESPGILQIIDYKTGQKKSWKTGRDKEYIDFEVDFQLNLYYYALSKLYPNIKQFIVTIYFIQFGCPYTMVFDQSNIIKTEEMIKQTMQEINQCKQPKLLKTWFCSRVCGFGKNPHPSGKMNTKTGKTYTICEYINKRIQQNGIQTTTEEERAEGFTPDYYQNPGE
jgi:hypothetical protein